MLLDPNHLDERFRLILRDELPCALVVRLRVRQAVIAAGLHEMRILFILRDLPADLILILFAELIQIQLVAEGSSHGDHAPRLHGSDPSGLVVRRCGDMRPD